MDTESTEKKEPPHWSETCPKCGAKAEPSDKGWYVDGVIGWCICRDCGHEYTQNFS